MSSGWPESHSLLLLPARGGFCFACGHVEVPEKTHQHPSARGVWIPAQIRYREQNQRDIYPHGAAFGAYFAALEQDDIEEEPGPKDLVLAKKVHEQLTDIILQLTSLKFDKIGLLREDSNGSFYIAPYVDPIMTAYPKYKAARFQPHEAEGKIAVSLGVDTASRPTTVQVEHQLLPNSNFGFLT